MVLAMLILYRSFRILFSGLDLILVINPSEFINHFQAISSHKKDSTVYFLTMSSFTYSFSIPYSGHVSASPDHKDLLLTTSVHLAPSFSLPV
jgi:hypothetical protein